MPHQTEAKVPASPKIQNRMCLAIDCRRIVPARDWLVFDWCAWEKCSSDLCRRLLMKVFFVVRSAITDCSRERPIRSMWLECDAAFPAERRARKTLRFQGRGEVVRCAQVFEDELWGERLNGRVRPFQLPAQLDPYCGAILILC